MIEIWKIILVLIIWTIIGLFAVGAFINNTNIPKDDIYDNKYYGIFGSLIFFIYGPLVTLFVIKEYIDIFKKIYVEKK